MEQLSVETGNKLIAEFDGITFEIVDKVRYPKDRHEYFVKYPNGSCFNRYGTIEDVIMFCDFRYHSSWEWLMPVVEKINQMKYAIVIESTFATVFKWRCKIYGTSTDCTFTSERYENPINGTYEAVIQFITWYQTQNKQQP